jgi:hypothetical protein
MARAVVAHSDPTRPQPGRNWSSNMISRPLLTAHAIPIWPLFLDVDYICINMLTYSRRQGSHCRAQEFTFCDTAEDSRRRPRSISWNGTESWLCQVQASITSLFEIFASFKSLSERHMQILFNIWFKFHNHFLLRFESDDNKWITEYYGVLDILRV